jgi:cobalt-precorrin-5B (C1)-methyltransferase
MKKGFTTGSCAAAAAKAAAYMLLSGKKKNSIEIDTPAGIKYCPGIEEIEMGEGKVICAVRKESGDDPDITNKTLIFAKVSYGDSITDSVRDITRVHIDGGRGVGRVTRPGLDQPVGNAAINSTPRKMIEAEVMQVMELFDYEGNLDVEIFVPEGEELAAKTFNPRLGIEGGISIIGTTGIVEPMSTKALLDTIYVELRQMKEMGATVAVVSPGNYGLDFMKEKYDFDLDRAVKCSNFIGDTIDMAKELGFAKLLLCGHVGKLIKVSGGIMNTHSKEADCRMELMAAAAIRCGASKEALQKILDCVSTEEAIEVYFSEGVEKKCFEYITEKIDFYLNKRAGTSMEAQCILYSNQYGLLGTTKKAEEFLKEAKGHING